MAEPISSASNAAADAADEEQAQLPKNAEDRKAAAALSALNANEMSQESEEKALKQPSAADQEALGNAMRRLELASGLGVSGQPGTAGKKPDEKKDTEVKKKVKIAAEDVNWLVRLCLNSRNMGFLTVLQVEELELSKVKATELLRSHDGDAVKAIKAFIAPLAKA